MDALDRDFRLIRPGPAEFERATRDDGSGVANDEEFRERTPGHRLSGVFGDRGHIGRLTLDRDLTGPGQRRQSRVPFDERCTVHGHFLCGQRAETDISARPTEPPVHPLPAPRRGRVQVGV